VNVVLLRVGIDTGSGGINGPLFADGSFEFLPIPDGPATSAPALPTYANTKGRYGRAFIEYFPRSRRGRMSNVPLHIDPEFDTFTYGDPTPPKRGLARLQLGDLLVFYAGLEGHDFTCAPRLYIVGFFDVAVVGLASQFSEAEIAQLFGRNAHVRDRTAFADQRERLLLVKGGAGSRLLTRAVPISEVGKNRLGQPLKILSVAMREIFGDFGGKLSIQRSPPRRVDPNFVDRAATFVRSLT